MIRNLLAAAALSLFAANAVAAEQKAAAVAVAQSEVVVELVSLDRDARIAVVRGPQGNTLTMKLPREAQNLDRVQPGDKFKMRYVEALALALNKGGTASSSQVQTVELAPRGARPGGMIVDTRQLVTTVTSVDRATRTIAVRGPQSEPISLKVVEEVKSFDEIAVGDTISVTYTEALMMEMIGEVRPVPPTK